ncbi:hypothetical protein Hdeb2414_s0005g00156581 [Helianthus debilis subsp. tardiflorus]
MMDCVWDQYEELVLEFHSTWKHKEGAFAQPNVVSFSLGQRVFEMDMAHFAVASGFYTATEMQSPSFATSLRGAYSTSWDVSVGAAKLSQFWATISDHPFTLINLITSVRNPIYRYILKILSTTLVIQKSGKNKANWVDLFILMCQVENREINLACVLAWSFSRGRCGGARAVLDMGPYITCFASNLHVFDRYKPQFLHEGQKTVIFRMRESQAAGIASYTDPIVWEEIR